MAQNNNKTKKCFHQCWVDLRIFEVGTPWDNRADIYIGLFKETVCRDLCMTNATIVLWDYWMERSSRIHNLFPRPPLQNQNITPHESTFGEKGDMSNKCNFGWYQWVYYRTTNSFTATKEYPGRFLAPINNEGSDMSQAVRTYKATIVPLQSICLLIIYKLNALMEKRRKGKFW